MSPYLDPPTPGAVRAALVAHLAKKLGYSGRTVAHLLEPLPNDVITRCLAVDPAEVRRALDAALAGALAAATGRAA